MECLSYIRVAHEKNVVVFFVRFRAPPTDRFEPVHRGKAKFAKCCVVWIFMRKTMRMIMAFCFPNFLFALFAFAWCVLAVARKAHKDAVTYIKSIEFLLTQRFLASFAIHQTEKSLLLLFFRKDNFQKSNQLWWTTSCIIYIDFQVESVNPGWWFEWRNSFFYLFKWYSVTIGDSCSDSPNVFQGKSKYLEFVGFFTCKFRKLRQLRLGRSNLRILSWTDL